MLALMREELATPSEVSIIRLVVYRAKERSSKNIAGGFAVAAGLRASLNCGAREPPW
jgi:hypothetical protein